MTQPAKFNFGNEFSSGSQTKQKELEAELNLLRARLPELEQAAYERGKADALAQAMNRIAQLFDRLNRDVITRLHQERESLEQEAIALAVTMSQNLAHQFISREPVKAIRDLAASCIESLRKSPHVVFRVHPDLIEQVEGSLKQLCYERGLEGKIIILGDPDIAQGDTKIEWADGGFERNQSDITQKINTLVSQYLDSRTQSITSTEGNNG